MMHTLYENRYSQTNQRIIINNNNDKNELRRITILNIYNSTLWQQSRNAYNYFMMVINIDLILLYYTVSS